MSFMLRAAEELRPKGRIARTQGHKPSKIPVASVIVRICMGNGDLTKYVINRKTSAHGEVVVYLVHSVHIVSRLLRRLQGEDITEDPVVYPEEAAVRTPRNTKQRNRKKTLTELRLEADENGKLAFIEKFEEAKNEISSSSFQGDANKSSKMKRDNKFIESQHLNETLLLLELHQHCSMVGAGSVVFNFESCAFRHEKDKIEFRDEKNKMECSEYCQYGFEDEHFELLAYLLKDFGCTVYVFDFALRSLMEEWYTPEERLLGPRPLRILPGKPRSAVEMHFDCEQMKETESEQLVTLGCLANSSGSGKGVAIIPCELAFGLSGSIFDRPEYEAEVLSVLEFPDYEVEQHLRTVVTSEKAKLGTVRGIEGIPGHTVLRYPVSERNKLIYDKLGLPPPQGKLFFCCGKWLEGARVESTADCLLATIENEHGKFSEMYKRCSETLAQTSDRAKNNCVATLAREYLESRPPCISNTVPRLIDDDESSGPSDI